jgi:YegS/Rv2252/BmrU family lipid kinase
MSLDAPFVLLVNPSAGGGRANQRLPHAEAELRRRRLDYRVVTTQGAEHACREALEAIEQGEIPVVLSGDGLIGQVGGVMAGGETPLGVIPGGRGNDFARMIGIPTDPIEAVGILTTGHERQIDVGEANGKRFLCIASTGFDAEANRIANEARILRGPPVYLYAALRALAAWKPAQFTITADGKRREVTGYTVAAANSKFYGGGMMAAPDADPTDGLLDVGFVADMGKLGFLAILARVFKGTHVAKDAVSSFRASEVRIEADRPFAVYADGEHLTELPVTVRLLPRALRVIAPQPQ